MTRLIPLAAAAALCVCGATSAFALSRDFNTMGLDYGWFHPSVEPQVTTYYPPEPVVAPRKHIRLRHPSR